MVDWLRGDEPPKRGYGWSAIDSVMLAEERRDVVYSWIHAHQLDDRYPDILGELETAGAKKIDVSKYGLPYARGHFVRKLALPEKLKVLPEKATSAFISV